MENAAGGQANVGWDIGEIAKEEEPRRVLAFIVGAERAGREVGTGRKSL
jgi:hypothetical protein